MLVLPVRRGQVCAGYVRAWRQLTTLLKNQELTLHIPDCLLGLGALSAH
jgi:hypothetical protein